MNETRGLLIENPNTAKNLSAMTNLIYLLIIFLPFMSFVISFFLGFYIGQRGSLILNIVFMALSAIVA